MCKHFLLFAMIGFSAAASIPNTASGTIIIDNFDAGEILAQFGVGTRTRITVDESILGGERTETIGVRDLNGREFFGVLGFGGQFGIGQSVNDSIYGSLAYRNLDGIDLTQAGFNDNFLLGFQGTDLDGSVPDAFWVVVTSGNVTQRVNINIPERNLLPGIVPVMFSSFDEIDMTNVDSVVLHFDLAQYPGNDFSINAFGAFRGLVNFRTTPIPEPAAGIFLVLATCMLPGTRRT